MVGLAQADSEKRNLKFDPPRLIGDEKQAEKVMRGGDSSNLLTFKRASVEAVALIGVAA